MSSIQPNPASPRLQPTSTTTSPRRRPLAGGAKALTNAGRSLATGALSRGTSIGSDFKAFITRGNVIDLAVGIVMGTAFTAIVNSLVRFAFLSMELMQDCGYAYAFDIACRQYVFILSDGV
jgi:hypothetical protein